MIHIANSIAFDRQDRLSKDTFLALSDYMFRLPIEKVLDGVRVEHLVDFLRKSTTKRQNLVLEKLRLADLLHFGLGETRKRDPCTEEWRGENNALVVLSTPVHQRGIRR